MRRRILLPVAAAVALTLVACGNSQDGPASGEYPESRLQQALGSVYDLTAGGDDEDWEKLQRENEKKREELIAQCMAEQGFDYIPSVYTYEEMPGLEEDDRSDLERAEQEGFGFFTDVEGYGAVTEVVDKNQEAVEKMSETERAAWDAALWGEPDDAGADGSDEYDWTTAGCQGKADHEVWGPSSDDPMMALYEDPQWAELSDGLSSIWDKIQSSPEMIELDKTWSQCVADEGVPGIASRDAMYEKLSQMQDELYDDMPEPTQQQLEDPDFVYPEPDPAKKEEFRKQEIEMAVASTKCDEKLNYSSKITEIYNKAEDQFYDENKALIDSFVAWATSQK